LVETNSLAQTAVLQRHRLVVCNLQIRLQVVHNQVPQLVVRNLGLRQEYLNTNLLPEAQVPQLVVRNLGLRQEVCIQILQQVVQVLRQEEQIRQVVQVVQVLRQEEQIRQVVQVVQVLRVRQQLQLIRQE
jgi:hypothetical protein